MAVVVFGSKNKNYTMNFKSIYTRLFNRIRIDGHTLYLSKDMAWCFRDGDYYEKNLTEIIGFVIKNIQGPVFYDIGANIGYYTIKMSPFAKEINSFEPVKKTFELLAKNKSVNNLENVHLHKYGVSNRNISLNINLYSSSGNDSIIKRNIPENHSCKFIGVEEIATVTLDSFVQNNNIALPDVIKIDVEGAELYVLEGAKGTINFNKPIIIFEYSESTFEDANYTFDDIIEYFKEMNYLFYGISNDNKIKNLITLSNDNLSIISNIIAIPDNHPILHLMKKAEYLV